MSDEILFLVGVSFDLHKNRRFRYCRLVQLALNCFHNLLLIGNDKFEGPSYLSLILKTALCWLSHFLYFKFIWKFNSGVLKIPNYVFSCQFRWNFDLLNLFLFDCNFSRLNFVWKIEGWYDNIVFAHSLCFRC